MDPIKHAEEMLREAACFGDEESVKTLVKNGVNVNVQHAMNGWTPLHWASKRGFVSIVRFLLASGADPKLKAAHGEFPIDVTANDEIKALLSSGKVELAAESSVPPPPLPIVPNYLAHPALAHKVEVSECTTPKLSSESNPPMADARVLLSNEELVVKVRTSNPPNQDFIEVEIPYRDLSFQTLLKKCCEELEVNRQKVVKLRKLPNTILRKDKDVLRLVNFAELEVVLLPDEYLDFSMTNGYSKSIANPEINGFIKNSSTLNRNARNSNAATSLLHKSSICKDGVILY